MLNRLEQRLSEIVNDQDSRERLERFMFLLEQWSRRHNLVRFRDRDELLGRHVLESLAVVPMLRDRERLGDIGSGGGLPGIPILACHPDWEGTLFEPRTKRTAFLRVVIRELRLSARVVSERFEESPKERNFSVLTMRAVRLDDSLLKQVRMRLEDRGRLIVWSTIEEFDRLRRKSGWRVISSPLPDLDRGVLIEMEPCFT